MFEVIDPILMISAVGGLILFALAYFIHQSYSENRSRSEVKKRLSYEVVEAEVAQKAKSKKPTGDKRRISKKVAEKANEYYSGSDPKSIKKLRMMLIQCGYLDPGAVGYFIAARFGSALLFASLGGLTAFTVYSAEQIGFKLGVIVAATAVGYFFPNVYLNRKIAATELDNRQGFPDILDLMVVSSEAGLTMEASIERISAELRKIYPNLSVQLNMAAVEIRAGKPIDEALRAFGERLRLEEVKGFATMVQQAKELGTSVSDALRVYSDEMRHKRMMKAEEKAYALPAKMSVPVTLFILPIVIGIAIIPTIVRWN